jgi:hypothetical protein
MINTPSHFLTLYKKGVLEEWFKFNNLFLKINEKILIKNRINYELVNLKYLMLNESSFYNNINQNFYINNKVNNYSEFFKNIFLILFVNCKYIFEILFDKIIFFFYLIIEEFLKILFLDFIKSLLLEDKNIKLINKIIFSNYGFSLFFILYMYCYYFWYIKQIKLYQNKITLLEHKLFIENLASKKEINFNFKRYKKQIHLNYPNKIITNQIYKPKIKNNPDFFSEYFLNLKGEKLIKHELKFFNYDLKGLKKIQRKEYNDFNKKSQHTRTKDFTDFYENVSNDEYYIDSWSILVKGVFSFLKVLTLIIILFIIFSIIIFFFK